MARENEQPVYAIVLAAGKGTRMKSSKAKVLHELFFAPMIHHVIKSLTPLQLNELIVVTGHQQQTVEDSLIKFKLKFSHQKEQRGTGDAVKSTESLLSGLRGVALILCGDTPLIRTETLAEMLKFHLSGCAKLTVMTTVVDDPTNYGRIISKDSYTVERIVEEKDANEDQRKINEINAGVYCVDIPFLFSALAKVRTNNSQGELYLTDIVSIIASDNEVVNKFVCDDRTEVLGVNSRIELACASQILQERRNLELMSDGVTMMDPITTFVDGNSTIAQDSTLYPNVFISGNCVLNEGCIVKPFVNLHDCCVGSYAIIDSFSNYTGKNLD